MLMRGIGAFCETTGGAPPLPLELLPLELLLLPVELLLLPLELLLPVELLLLPLELLLPVELLVDPPLPVEGSGGGPSVLPLDDPVALD